MKHFRKINIRIKRIVRPNIEKLLLQLNIHILKNIYGILPDSLKNISYFY